MGLFDGTGIDWSNMNSLALAGMAEALAQTSMPSRMPIPTGAVWGNLAGGMARGAKAGHDLEKDKLDTELTRAKIPVLRQQMEIRKALLQELAGLTGGASANARSPQVGGAFSPSSGIVTDTPSDGADSGSDSLVAGGGLAKSTANALAGEYGPLIQSAASEHGIPPDIFARQIAQESSFNPRAVSPAGALGIAQFMPDTAKRFGIDPLNPSQAIPAAAKYVARNRDMFGGNLGLALAGYNWGEGNVQKWLQSGANPAAMPGETRRYVADITGQPIDAWLGGGGAAAQPRPVRLAQAGMPTMTDAAPDLNAILAEYTPQELAAFRARGMIGQNGVPSVPPGVFKINSRGEPYSRELETMSPQERANVRVAMAAIKNAQQTGRPWYASAAASESAPSPVQVAQAEPAAPAAQAAPAFGSLAPAGATVPQGPGGIDPLRLARLRELGALGGMAGLGQGLWDYYTSSPEFKARVRDAEKGVDLRYLPQEKKVEQMSKYFGPEADPALQSRMVAEKARAEIDAKLRAMGINDPNSPEGQQAARNMMPDTRPEAVRLADAANMTPDARGQAIAGAIPGNAPTGSIKEFEYGQKTPGFSDFLTQQNRSKAMMLNTAPGMEAAQAQARIAVDVATAKEIGKQAIAGQRVLPLLDEVVRLADKTPEGWSGPAASTMAKAFSAAGIPISEGMSNAELLQSISQRLVPIVREPGPTSEKELNIYLRAVPGLMQSAPGRVKVAEMTKRMIYRSVEIAKIYRENLGSPDLYAKLAEIDKPIFTDDQRAEIERLGGGAAAGATTSPPDPMQTPYGTIRQVR